MSSPFRAGVGGRVDAGENALKRGWIFGFPTLALVGPALAGPLAPVLMAQAPPGTGGPAAPARDGTVAIQEELDAARRAGTVAAYDLFLARHPGHPLAAQARQERERLVAAPKR